MGSESVARRLYGTTEVVGRTVEISYVPYTIRAVVRDVSLLAESAYGDVWLPYTTDNSLYDNGSDRLVGASVVISSQVRPPTLMRSTPRLRRISLALTNHKARTY